jgi:hypothetical protein
MFRSTLIALSVAGPIAATAFVPTIAVAQDYGPDTCREGYVWREAFPGDHICVRPWVRDQASRDNWRSRYRYRYS